MMQEDATYMNLFVVEQFYKIFKFHFIQDGSFNLIPHIIFIYLHHRFSQILVLSLSLQVYKNDSFCVR